MLLGIWTNVAHLEECLNLPELEAILLAARDKEHRHHKFLAALKGIDLDEGDKRDAQDRFAEIQRRVEAKLHGKSEAQLEYDVFGIDVEIEE